MNGKKRRVKRTGISILAIIALLICGVLIYKTTVLEKTFDTKEAKLEEINEKIKDAELESEEIADEERFGQTDDGIEERARGLGLVNPDDYVFVPDTGKE